jgi:hypothetical protein
MYFIVTYYTTELAHLVAPMKDTQKTYRIFALTTVRLTLEQIRLVRGCLR